MFSASKDILSTALALAGSCVQAAHTIPIYTYLLLEGDPTMRANGVAVGDLWITGSDGDVTITTCVEAPLAEKFAYCVPAKQFIDLISLFGGDFTAEPNGGRVVIKHGRARHKIPFRPREEYPDTPEIIGASLELPGNLLRRMIEASEIAVDLKPDGKFPAMRGLHLSVGGGWLHLVGCDGVRLAAASHPIGGDFDVILPHKAALVFAKFAEGPEPVEIIPQENQISLRGERGNVVARKLVGQFPDWKLAIPQNLTYTADIAVPALILAIRRVALASNVRDSMNSPAFSLKFTFTTSELKLEAQSAEKGEAVEYVDIECPNLKEPVMVGVAGRQILDFLGVVSTGHLLLGFRDAQTALEFRPKQEFGFEFRYVSMPVALRW